MRRLEREIHEVEEGRSETLSSGYPRELSGVATNLNALLVGERKRVSRYRDTLGNLAHSLKTPLAVMRSSLPAAPADEHLGREIDRMGGIIEHQLKRAAAGGALLGQAPVDVPALPELPLPVVLDWQPGNAARAAMTAATAMGASKGLRNRITRLCPVKNWLIG